MPRFPSNLADSSPINLPSNLELGELHFDHYLHTTFTSSTPPSQTQAVGQSQGRFETSEARSPERRRRSNQKTSTWQHPEFDYLFFLYSLLFDNFCRMFFFVLALYIFFVFLYAAMSD
jgi:hypothetical protein